MSTHPTVIAGVDGTRAGFEAARQAARLMDPEGRLLIAGVFDQSDAFAARWGGVSFALPQHLGEWTIARREEELRRRIDATLATAAEQVDALGRVETRQVTGRSWEALRELAKAERASLVAVGTHGGSRLRGIVMGHTPTDLAHNAPCSVLIARPSFDPKRFPASLVVGYDGSDHARAALAVAEAIAGRHPHAAARVLFFRPLLRGVEELDAPPRLPARFEFEMIERLPDDGLVEESERVDLVLVGSRGLAGLQALGSVSERVAHQASSSVLIVREPDWS